jgi:hypothetical protein
VKSEIKIKMVRDFDFTKVRYYTLQFDDEPNTELHKFFQSMKKLIAKVYFILKHGWPILGRNMEHKKDISDPKKMWLPYLHLLKQLNLLNLKLKKIN